MSRSLWAAVLGVSVFALAATLSASPGAPVHPRKHPRRASCLPSPDRSPHRPCADAGASPSGAARERHQTPRTLGCASPTQPRVVLLAPGSGFQQAAGSGRVRALQRRLTGLGFAPGPIDGRYGPLTTQAVERFQSASGLSADGIVGPRSSAALNAKTATTGAELRPGDGYRANAGLGRVRVLQRRLARLGFAPGPIDGRYGPLTTHAVERFQSARRLAVNGVVGAGTLRALLTIRRRSPVTVSSQPRHSSNLIAPFRLAPRRRSSQPRGAVRHIPPRQWRRPRSLADTRPLCRWCPCCWR